MQSSSGNLVVKTHYTPKIQIEAEALEQAKYFLRAIATECQWFHRVERIRDGSDIIYRIYDIYIPEQTVAAATVESDPELIVKLSNEVKDRTGGYNEEYNDIISSLTCWCHSHVNMGVTPSGTDNTQFKEQIEAGGQNQTQPQVMMILNKQNKYFSRVYDPNLNLIFENVPVEVISSSEHMAYVKDAIANKLKKKVYQPQHNYPRQFGQLNHSIGHHMGARHTPAPNKKPTSTAARTQTQASLGSPTSIKNSRKTQTAESYSDNTNYVEEYDLQAILTEQNASELVYYINCLNEDSTKFAWAASRLMEIIEGAFTPRQIDIMATLLFCGKEIAIKQIPRWLKDYGDHAYEYAVLEIETNIMACGVDPAESLLEAISVINYLRSNNASEDWLQIIDAWYGDDDEEDDAHTEAELTDSEYVPTTMPTSVVAASNYNSYQSSKEND